jgi:capsular polysaccharide biosynthesis protein
VDLDELPDEFDAPEFGRYALGMWKPAVAAMAVAVVLSAGLSLLLPKRYTATSSLMIDLPAGSDPRAAAALSPVYLESLKTYEHFASSDTIFLEAIDHLGIRTHFPGKSVESLKRSVLRISRPASTRVLEISATLDNPDSAQRMARYVADRTVDLNRSLASLSARSIVSDAESIYRAAFERLQRADRARDEFSRAHQIEPLAGAVDNLIELRFDLQRDLQETRASLREFEARAAAGGGGEDDAAGARARIGEIQQQDESMAKRIGKESVEVEELKARREQLDAEQKGARAEAETAKTRLNEARASLAYQGERLSVLDPGIVPERPSFPNLPLNIAVAFVLSLMGSLLWIAWRYSGHRPRLARPAKRAYSLAD